MRDSVRSCILNLVAYEPGKPIEELAREIGFVPEKILKLASNENPLGPSPRALGAMQQALAQSHLYPDGEGFSLREAIATRCGLAIENVVLGNGRYLLEVLFCLASWLQYNKYCERLESVHLQFFPL